MKATRKDIITLPHDSLRKRSKRVGLISDEITDTINQMVEATIDWESHREHELGVALAAVQINILYRVIIIRHNLENKEDKRFDYFINPEITKREGPIIEDFEGCLSIKDVYGKVPRHRKIKVKALDASGTPIRITVEGFLARILQHEIDHTNGQLYIDHIKDKTDAFYKLTDKGELEAIDYETTIKNSRILW